MTERIIRLRSIYRHVIKVSTFAPGVVRRVLCREGRSGNILWDFCSTQPGHRDEESYNTALELSTTKKSSRGSIVIYDPSLKNSRITPWLGFCSLYVSPYTISLHRKRCKYFKIHVATPSSLLEELANELYSDFI